jgi:hypothetical protein
MILDLFLKMGLKIIITLDQSKILFPAMCFYFMCNLGSIAFLFLC